MLRAMRRELETERRMRLLGHEGENPGDGQGDSYAPPRQLSTLPRLGGEVSQLCSAPPVPMMRSADLRNGGDARCEKMSAHCARRFARRCSYSIPRSGIYPCDAQYLLRERAKRRPPAATVVALAGHLGAALVRGSDLLRGW
jgi:hypothetical protein